MAGIGEFARLCAGYSVLAAGLVFFFKLACALVARVKLLFH